MSAVIFCRLLRASLLFPSLLRAKTCTYSVARLPLKKFLMLDLVNHEACKDHTILVQYCLQFR